MSSTNQSPIRAPRSTSWGKGLLTGILCTVLSIALVVWLVTGTGLLHLLRPFAMGSLIHIDQPTVVRQIQQLQRLETVSYSMDKIISGEHGNAFLPKFLAGDRLLLVVHGEVVGGINLGALRPADVVIHGQTVSLHLPAA